MRVSNSVPVRDNTNADNNYVVVDSVYNIDFTIFEEL